MRESREFRTRFGGYLDKRLTELAEHWQMDKTEYVRHVLMDHVKREPFAKEGFGA